MERRIMTVINIICAMISVASMTVCALAYQRNKATLERIEALRALADYHNAPEGSILSIGEGHVFPGSDWLGNGDTESAGFIDMQRNEAKSSFPSSSPPFAFEPDDVEMAWQDDGNGAVWFHFKRDDKPLAVPKKEFCRLRAYYDPLPLMTRQGVINALARLKERGCREAAENQGAGNL